MSSKDVTGTVKFFNRDKGFGFIAPDAGGEDVFVHITEVTKSPIGAIAEGDKVVFDTKPSERKPNKGPVAFNIRGA